MEVVFIIFFAALFVIFFVLWMTDRSRNDSLTVDSKPIRDIRETLDQSLERITAIEDKLSVVPDGSGPLSIDDVRNALLANDIAPETIDSSESGRIWFTIDNTRFSNDQRPLLASLTLLQAFGSFCSFYLSLL